MSNLMPVGRRMRSHSWVLRFSCVKSESMSRIRSGITANTKPCFAKIDKTRDEIVNKKYIQSHYYRPVCTYSVGLKRPILGRVPCTFCRSVGLSVGKMVKSVYCAKMADSESVEMTFGVVSQVGPRNEPTDKTTRNSACENRLASGYAEMMPNNAGTRYQIGAKIPM